MNRQRSCFDSSDEEESVPKLILQNTNGISKATMSKEMPKTAKPSGSHQQPIMVAPSCHAEKFLLRAKQDLENKKSLVHQQLAERRSNEYSEKKNSRIANANEASSKRETNKSITNRVYSIEKDTMDTPLPSPTKAARPAGIHDQQKERMSTTSVMPLAAGPFSTRRDGYRLNKKDAAKLGELIEEIARIQYPNSILLTDLFGLIEKVEPRFISIKQSGFADHTQFLQLHAQSVLVAGVGDYINILWNVNGIVATDSD